MSIFETKPYEFLDYENIVSNMSAGLLPEYLTQAEVAVLIEKYGDGWFEELGYNDKEYNRPQFDEME